MYPSKKARIAYLKVDNTPTKIPSMYADSVNILSTKLATELLNPTGINDYTIKLVDD